ncbi:ABC transporter, permease protein [Gleimia coleocanis DSM 15436]|uniref:Oligopeptide transport system permease protein OppC n=1 Tax=Gleimia coleocanis DSM 15436 TaxID=525245 RepID=C0VZP2_9ACTO|nr:ABC transporter permease [Gleimia coleocanis]EEH64161.1 ABC transporter, permease protein [Gleimia coleocanis DSM 15436]
MAEKNTASKKVAEAKKDKVAKSEAHLNRSALVRRRFFRSNTARLGVIGMSIIVLIAIFGPMLSPWGYTEVDNTSFLKPPSAQHWFGTTQGGRDVFALTVQGLRQSLVIGFCVSLIQTTLAAVIGSTAAYFGKVIDKTILWVIDLLLVIPSFLLIAVISQRTGDAKGSIAIFILLLAAFGWMLSARVVRSLTMSVKNLEYVTAARYMSVPSWVIITRHIIPNVASYLIIDAALGFVSAVMGETVLSYFGFGVQAPNTSLGVLISEGQSLTTSSPWIFMAPATLLTLSLIFVNLIGDGLRDAIDPSSKSGGKA